MDNKFFIMVAINVVFIFINAYKLKIKAESIGYRRKKSSLLEWVFIIIIVAMSNLFLLVPYFCYLWLILNILGTIKGRSYDYIKQSSVFEQVRRTK